ncbi:hypothetical protein Lal_00040154 [Lupinus albus]|nr:hypothetical protein Lal_00040154 [Lupinus albus]
MYSGRVDDQVMIDQVTTREDVRKEGSRTCSSRRMTRMTRRPFQKTAVPNKDGFPTKKGDDDDDDNWDLPEGDIAI